ncbi:MAG: alcohol dehydrogenase catalytic domain-containing protein [Anaerolineae bacterium]|nr:alcohol dehydrogenase catalytic domain-containing protein [Thermoflexus sp.]MDW8065301.1 alcohol dehydrogenase catalytic domain-containing protein [Anaerolineae bacterium]
MLDVYPSWELEIRYNYSLLSGEAQVRLKIAGICNTDLGLRQGSLNLRGVPNHEFVGIVEEVPGHLGWIGKRIVGEIGAAGGVYHAHRAERSTRCPKRAALEISSRGSTFAEHPLLLVLNLHEASPEIPQWIHIYPTDRLVVECMGSQEGFHLTHRWVRPRGTLIMKSTDRITVEARPIAIAMDEVAAISSRFGLSPYALRLLQRGLVDVFPLIHARHVLPEVAQAFERAREGMSKVLLDVS